MNQLIKDLLTWVPRGSSLGVCLEQNRKEKEREREREREIKREGERGSDFLPCIVLSHFLDGGKKEARLK